jgi:ferritin-like metal-binding protein YciE
LLDGADWQAFGTIIKATIARVGNKITERTEGAPTIAAAMIAAAQRIEFAITYFRFMAISYGREL